MKVSRCLEIRAHLSWGLCRQIYGREALFPHRNKFQKHMKEGRRKQVLSNFLTRKTESPSLLSLVPHAFPDKTVGGVASQPGQILRDIPSLWEHWKPTTNFFKMSLLML